MNINYKIGDCREVLKNFEDGVFDACVTDPPYGLEFMGKEWDKLKVGRSEKYAKPSTFSGTGSGSGRSQDKGDYSWFGSVAKRPVYFNRPAKRCKKCGKQAWSGSPCQCDTPEWELDNSALLTAQKWHYLWAKQVYRVLKPGGYLLAFGGTRTYHRMVCAVEDAGFEIRDTIAWIYGSGFPKSLDISKQIDKIHGAERKQLQERVYADGNPRRCKSITMGVGETYAIHGKEVSPSQAEKWRESEPRFETAPMTSDAKKWSGYGTALKPAVEPIVVARKPIAEKNVAMNVLTHGVGGINIDGTRIEGLAGKPWGRVHPHRGNYPGWQLDKEMVEAPEPHPQGRFPANIILECTCEKVIPGKVGTPNLNPKGAGFVSQRGIYHGDPDYEVKDEYIRGYNDTAPIHTDPNCPCYMLDAQSGELSSGMMKAGTQESRIHRDIYGQYAPRKTPADTYADKGGASRFFYVAKASRRERWFYCSVCKKAYSGDKRENHKKHSMHCLDCGVDYEPVTQYEDKRGIGNFPNEQFWGGGVGRTYQVEHRDCRTKSNLLFHVTQKPEQLIRYLIRLVTPEGGTVLDPFLGSGTTLVAARMEGMNALGIELSEEYEPLIKGRLNALPRALEEFHQPTTKPSPKESITYTQETE